MKNTQQRVLQALRRVLNYGAANPTIIPPATGSSDTWTALTKQFAAIGTIIDQVSDAAAEQGLQAANAKLGSTNEPSLRKAVRVEMHSITQVAQQLKKTVPGIGMLKMPPTTIQTEPLITYAVTLTKQAATYDTVLIEHGLAADFIAQLQRAIATLKSSVDGRGNARKALVGATKQLSTGLALGIQYVHIIDAALTKTLQSNPVKLAEWKNARRITIKGVNTTSTTAPTEPTATTPAAVLAPITNSPVTTQAIAAPQSVA